LLFTNNLNFYGLMFTLCITTCSSWWVYCLPTECI